MPRLLRFLDRNRIPRDTVTLVFDKGSAALYNTLVLDQSRWLDICSPWNQAPPEFRAIPLEQLKSLSSEQLASRRPAQHCWSMAKNDSAY